MLLSVKTWLIEPRKVKMKQRKTIPEGKGVDFCSLFTKYSSAIPIKNTQEGLLVSFCVFLDINKDICAINRFRKGTNWCVKITKIQQEAPKFSVFQAQTSNEIYARVRGDRNLLSDEVYKTLKCISWIWNSSSPSPTNGCWSLKLSRVSVMTPVQLMSSDLAQYKKYMYIYIICNLM